MTMQSGHEMAVKSASRGTCRLLVSAACALLACGLPLVAQDAFYVSRGGDDANPGTWEQPWKSIQKARDHLREHKGGMTADITVWVRGGVYPLAETLVFNDSDSGTGGFRIHYAAMPGERPVLSGGTRVTGWVEGEGGIWSAPFLHPEKVRDLWVGGVRRAMARNGFGDADKIKGQGGWGSYEGSPTGIRFLKSDIAALSRHEDIELWTNRRWTQHLLCVAEVLTDPARPGEWVFRMQEPYFNIAQNPGYPEHAPNPTRTYWVVNALELLDEPGEFYHDRTEGRMYYMPAEGEDMASVEVVAPLLERLVVVEGGSMSAKAENITFSGLGFQHSAWQLDRIGDSRGASSSQGPKLLRFKGSWAEAEGDALLVAAIELSAARSIAFHRNTFSGLGGAAINLINGVDACIIEGNRFEDIGASAVAVAHPDLRDTTVLTQFAEEEPCSDNVIRNNHIRGAGTSFWPAPAIIGFHPTRLEISHNDIAGSSYSGISLGWTWNYYFVTPCRENKVWNNRIFDSCQRLWDGGSIYLLGRQPDTSIQGNHIGGNVDFGAVYADQGASKLAPVLENLVEVPAGKNFFYAHAPTTRDFDVTKTVTTSPNFLNAATNVAIIDTTVIPDVTTNPKALQIAETAGLQPAYEDIADPATHPPAPAWPDPPAYESWALGEFGAVAAGDQSQRESLWGPEADADGDSLPNLVEMGAGTNAQLREPALAPTLRVAGETLTLRFFRDPASPVTLVVERTEDFSHWTEAGVDTALIGTMGGLLECEATTATGVTGQFLRLRAKVE